MKEKYNNLRSMLGFLVRFHLKKDCAATVSVKTAETVCEGGPQGHQ